MEHYFSPKQKSELDLREFKVEVAGKDMHFFSAKGVFSQGHIDTGSLVLINAVDCTEGDSLLDLGCGIGIIGIILKTLHTGISVTFSDVNERAIMLTKMNLKRYGIEAQTIVSDTFEKIPHNFDVIVLNPPFHAGRSVCLKLIDEAYTHLNKEGSLQIVARHKKGGAVLSQYMEEVFGNVEVLSRKSGFRVYKASK